MTKPKNIPVYLGPVWPAPKSGLPKLHEGRRRHPGSVRELVVFSDAEMRPKSTKSGKPGQWGASGMGAIVVNENGVILAESGKYRYSISTNQAEMEAILLGLLEARKILRNPEACRVRCFTDSQTAWYYLHALTGDKQHLCKVRDRILEVQNEFGQVNYIKTPRDSKGFRRSESIARKKLRENGHMVSHRGSKGAKKRRGKSNLPNPFESGAQ